LGKLHIGAVGEERVILQFGADRGEVYLRNVVHEDYQGNLYLVLCDPGIHPIGSVCMEQSELDDAVKLGKREDYTGELLEEIPE
jgi:hypothetical protein